MKRGQKRAQITRAQWSELAEWVRRQVGSGRYTKEDSLISIAEDYAAETGIKVLADNIRQVQVAYDLPLRPVQKLRKAGGTDIQPKCAEENETIKMLKKVMAMVEDLAFQVRHHGHTPDGQQKLLGGI